jgi:alpha-L-rhamnosidase
LILVPGVHPWGRNVKDLALRKPVIPLFRTEFVTDKNIRSAHLFISGLGHYKAYITGNQISDDFLSPGWTDYQKLCLYNIYDVKEQLMNGINALGIMVGSGFYNVHNERYRKLLITYGMPKLLGKLKIVYDDGTEQNVVTGPDWKTASSPYTFSTMFGGETFNANLVQTGWDKPGFDDQNWQDALLARHPGGVLRPETTYPILEMESFSPKQVQKLDSINYLYDFGQNASGIVSIRVQGKKGQKLRLIPGELVTEEQYVNQQATGRPYYWEYILKGDGEEVWQPQFTYYGFRYVQVEGAKPAGEKDDTDKPEILEIKSLHTYNSAPRVGEFSNSNDLFNRVNRLILYAMQSNFQSVLTDCPHREKLGWLEQTHLVGRSMHYNYDLYHIYRKQVMDMMDAQTPEGLIPSIAPEYVLFDGGFRDSPEWGSAGVILPWLLYEWYGDISVMKTAWPMMLRYMEYLDSMADGHVLSHGLGDWYDLGPKPPGYSQLTPFGLTATAIYFYNAKIMSEMASLMGKKDEEKRLAVLAGEIKDAFNAKFFDPKGKIYATGSQTSLAMPLVVGLVNEEDRAQVFHNLTDSIKNNGKALTAGDVGFHYLVKALTEGGASQLFYEMNNRDDIPGYGYQLKKGATALTESWAALETVSNNHMMLGHIMEWFYAGLGGIRQEENSSAFKRIVIKPDMVGDITHSEASYESPYGLIINSWAKKNDKTEINVTIPVNATATIYLPADNVDQIREGGNPLKEVQDIKVVGKENGRFLIRIGSGKYKFVVDNDRESIVSER